MATFSCDIYATGQTTAHIDAEFTGGDPDYARYRFLKVTIGGTQLALIQSIMPGGADSDFSSNTAGLTAGTTYSWSCILCYEDADGNIQETTYTDSGSFTTDQDNGNVFIWDGSDWVNAKPYIWDGSAWTPAKAYIFNGTWQQA